MTLLDTGTSLLYITPDSFDPDFIIKLMICAMSRIPTNSFTKDLRNVHYLANFEWWIKN
jgi:hypothetical protein